MDIDPAQTPDSQPEETLPEEPSVEESAPVEAGETSPDTFAPAEDTNNPGEPAAASDAPASKNKNKAIALVTAVAVLIAAMGIGAYVVLHRSDVTLGRALSATMSEPGVDATMSVHVSKEAMLYFGLTDTQIKSSGVDSISNLDELSKAIDQVGIRVAVRSSDLKDPKAAFGISYGGVDVLMATMINRTLYVHTDPLAITQVNPSLVTAKQVNDVIKSLEATKGDSANILGLDPKQAALLAQVLKGTPLAYSFAPSTTGGKAWDEALKSSGSTINDATAKISPAWGSLIDAIPDALKNSSQITGAGDDQYGQHMLVVVDIKALAANLHQQIFDLVKAMSDASGTKVTDKELTDQFNKALNEIKGTQTLDVWVKDGRISRVSVDVTKEFFDAYNTTVGTAKDVAMASSLSEAGKTIQAQWVMGNVTDKSGIQALEDELKSGNMIYVPNGADFAYKVSLDSVHIAVAKDGRCMATVMKIDQGYPVMEDSSTYKVTGKTVDKNEGTCVGTPTSDANAKTLPAGSLTYIVTLNPMDALAAPEGAKVLSDQDIKDLTATTPGDYFQSLLGQVQGAVSGVGGGGDSIVPTSTSLTDVAKTIQAQSVLADTSYGALYLDGTTLDLTSSGLDPGSVFVYYDDKGQLVVEDLSTVGSSTDSACVVFDGKSIGGAFKETTCSVPDNPTPVGVK